MDRAELLGVWASLFRTSIDQVQILLKRAPYQYKHYTIPKRTGGVRHIYHPAPNLKALQRWLVGNVFHELPVHDSVHSYRKGKNIKGHARVHLHSNYLLKLDFSDFFPSIDHEWILSYLLKQFRDDRSKIEAEAIPDIARICCRYQKSDKTLALSIGAPSSPALSNAILFDADFASSVECDKIECAYTRYADDIYISSREKDRLVDGEKMVRDVFATLAPKLRFNESKTINVSKKYRRVVTGVILTPDRHLSVGRDLKRKIKTEVYLWSKDQLPAENIPRLCGLVSYVRDVEPEFFVSLCTKFGPQLIDQLFRNEPRTAAWKEIPF